MKIYVERIVTKSFRLFGVIISSDIKKYYKIYYKLVLQNWGVYLV